MYRSARRKPSRTPCNPVVILLAALLLLMCVLCFLPKETSPDTTLDTPGTTAGTQPSASTDVTQSSYGWQEDTAGRYYQNPDGTRATGWLDDGTSRYYLDENGYAHTGWLSEADDRYYFLPDGTMAKGKVVIDGTARYFTSQGREVILVNRWNSVPEDYIPTLVDLSTSISVKNSRVDQSCYEALLAMIADCNKECPKVCVVSSYRTNDHQTNSYNRKVNYYKGLGYSEEDAKEEAGTIIARPGTSEHQLGLAVDIIDTRLWELTEAQADLPAQKWLMENSWRYGFILRYPKGKIDVTGIIYEPWHYRYVGEELAKELHDTGLTLEEYLENLTQE